MQAARNCLLPAVFSADGGREEWNICDAGEEVDEGGDSMWRPPAWRRGTAEERARFCSDASVGIHIRDLPAAARPPLLELTPDPLEGVSVEQLLRRCSYRERTSNLLYFQTCDPPAGRDDQDGPPPPTYKAIWCEGY